MLELVQQTIAALEAGSLGVNEIDQIKEVINFCDQQYYVHSKQVISDYQYDQLFFLLKKIEKENPLFVTLDSPTQRIAYAISEEFESVDHLTPMLSLDNSYNAQDLHDFDRKVKEGAQITEASYSVEPKFDGAGISLVYENGKLQRALTRGNGIQGEDITNNAKVIKTIPLSIPMSQYGLERLEVRGEIMISKEYFEHFNSQREADGLGRLANTRNAASGSLRMKESEEVAKRGLEAFIYHVSLAQDKDGNNVLDKVFSTQSGTTELLKVLGFRSPFKEYKKCFSISEVVDFISSWAQRRDAYGYEIDGMVIKLDDLQHYKALGYTAHHPRWAIAYKFKAKQAETTLNDVEWQVGRTGTITPVAKVDPVKIAGVTVSSLTMFNEDFIIEKDVRLGDKILIERAGDVIPYVVGPVVSKRKGTEKKIQFPNLCPACSSKLFQEEGEAAWRCRNSECPPQLIERLKHFVSKNALDVVGMGASIVERFCELGYLKGYRDIFRLPYEELAALEGFGIKSVNKLKAGIENAKEQELYRKLFGLGVRFVGETTAKNLCKQVDDLRDFKNWTLEELEGLEDVGPKVAESVFNFFHDEGKINLLNDLEALGMVLSHDRSATQVSAVFEGKTFLFTGTLEQMGRKEAQKLVEEHGGKNISSVSKNLDYLVIGAKAGSKLKKAQTIDSIAIITEQEFIDLIG